MKDNIKQNRYYLYKEQPFCQITQEPNIQCQEWGWDSNAGLRLRFSNYNYEVIGDSPI